MGEDAGAPDILLITLGFPPARGGIQSCLYERTRLTAGRIVVLAPAHPAAAAFDVGQPFPIQRWPAFLSQVPILKRLAQLVFSLALGWRLCRRYPIRCIECGQALPFGVVAWLLGRARGIPYRVWVYGDDILKPARWFPLRWLLLAILRPAQRLIAVSAYSRRLLLGLGLPAGQIEVIYPIVPICHAERSEASHASAEFASSDANSRAGVACSASEDASLLMGGVRRPGRRPTLLTVARLVPRKGVDVLIRLMPALAKQYPAVVLQIVGDGSERQQLEGLAQELGVQKQVAFLGDVPPASLPAQYAACDIFVLLPTPDERRGEAEGLGIVYLEAAACGRPCVAWKTGGVEEAVLDGRTGLLVPCGDAEAARWALAGLLADPAWASDLGRQARAWVEDLVARSAAQLRRLDGEA